MGDYPYSIAWDIIRTVQQRAAQHRAERVTLFLYQSTRAAAGRNPTRFSLGVALAW